MVGVVLYKPKRLEAGFIWLEVDFKDGFIYLYTFYIRTWLV
jgi:hypothetical protein